MFISVNVVFLCDKLAFGSMFHHNTFSSIKFDSIIFYLYIYLHISERFLVKNQHSRRLITPPLRYAPYKTHSPDSLIVVGPPVKNVKKVYPFGCNNKTVTQRNVLKMRHVSVVPRKLRIAPNMKRCDKDVKLSNHVEKWKTKQMCPSKKSY